MGVVVLASIFGKYFWVLCGAGQGRAGQGRAVDPGDHEI